MPKKLKITKDTLIVFFCNFFIILYILLIFIAQLSSINTIMLGIGIFMLAVLYLFLHKIPFKCVQKATPYRAYARLGVSLLLMICLAYFIAMLSETYFPIKVESFYDFMSIITLIFLLAFLIEFFIGFIKVFDSYIAIVKKNKWENVEFFILIISGLIAAFLVPDFVFGFTYQTLIYNTDLNMFDFFYLSFVIHYALPLNHTEFLTIIKAINSQDIGRYIQMAHIISNRIIDLIFISTTISYLVTYFKKAK